MKQEFFYFSRLPFAEDLRQYPFAPLQGENVRNDFRPTTEQISAAEDLINSMDLTVNNKNYDNENDEYTSIFTLTPHNFREYFEYFKPKNTVNPTIQYFYQTLHFAALHPGTFFLSIFAFSLFII